MPITFPPGATAWDTSKVKSEWREFSFALHQIQQAINPVISLKKVMANWGKISSSLAERSRKRKPQLSNYSFS